MSKPEPDNNFLSDLTDGREKGNWQSRYDENALKEIKKERLILLIYLFGSFVLVFISGLYFKKYIPNIDCNLLGIKPYVFCSLGGFIGGTVFSMKWLVHSVAKHTWNYVRQFWRMMTPMLSGTVALLILILINADIFKSDIGSSYSTYKSFGIGFLSGYFSDNAIGKMTEIAQVLFGSSASKK